jgi:hypothetical protein
MKHRPSVGGDRPGRPWEAGDRGRSPLRGNDGMKGAMPFPYPAIPAQAGIQLFRFPGGGMDSCWRKNDG